MSNNVKLDFSKLTTKDFPFKNKLDREQEDMVVKLYKNQRVIVDAVAGSGKTTVLTQAMKVLLDKGFIDTIYYVVFPVQEQALGYLPGDVSDKIKEYSVPFMQALKNAGVNTENLDVHRMCDEFIPYKYKVVPHTFLRGRTLDKVGIIIDETQNATVHEIKKTLTRITDDCYVGIAGHNGQQDINCSGFAAAISHFKAGKHSGEFTGIDFAELSTDYRGKFSSFSDKLGG